MLLRSAPALTRNKELLPACSRLPDSRRLILAAFASIDDVIESTIDDRGKLLLGPLCRWHLYHVRHGRENPLGGQHVGRFRQEATFHTVSNYFRLRSR